MLETERVRVIVRAALEEDVGPGDRTTEAVIGGTARARGTFVAREALVAAGIPVAGAVFAVLDPAVAFRARVGDGDAVPAGTALATVEGPARPILTGERVALNFLQRLCGIATTTRRLAERVAGSGAVISDTRKTTPGLRHLERYAVRVGGGSNHRAGLFDAVLIKDNHIRVAGGVGAALRAARAARAAGRFAGPIAIEVGTPAETEEALREGAEALLLDNMDPVTLERAVALARGRAFLEVSGGVREEDLPRIAALGVQRVSLGLLTHSVRAADVALDLDPA
jgi:nicotinate-nucleotide pyrophosphorylase (carboxylating)